MPGTPVIHHAIGSPDSAPGTPNYEEEFFPADFVPPAPPEELSPMRRLLTNPGKTPSHLNPPELFNPEDLDSSFLENSEDELHVNAPEAKEVRLTASRPPTPRLNHNNTNNNNNHNFLPPVGAVAGAAAAGASQRSQLGTPQLGTPVKAAAAAPATTGLLRSPVKSSAWAVAATGEGRLYFYARGVADSSQWTCPSELFPYFPGTFDGNGNLPASIFHAAFSGGFAYLHAYWRVGGSFRATDHLGRSALHFAAAGGHVDLVLWLLEVDMEILNYQDREGSSPLSLACRYGHGLIVKHLVEAGSSISGRDIIEAETFAGPELAAYLIGNRKAAATDRSPSSAGFARDDSPVFVGLRRISDDVANAPDAVVPPTRTAAPAPQSLFEAVKPVLVALRNRFFGSS